MVKSETLEANWVGHARVEVCLHVREVDAIVRSLRSRQRALHSAEIELHDLTRVGWISLAAVMLDKKILLAEILFNELNIGLVTTSDSKVLHSAIIDWEIAHGCAILRSHVRDRGSIGKAEALDTRAKELNEFADDTALS